MNEILEKSYTLADLLESKKDIIIDALLDYESYETAMDEIERSLDTLRHIDIEVDYLQNIHGKEYSHLIERICTFFPLNLPLYSLILFAVVPSFSADNVYVRPPIFMRDILRKVYDILEITDNYAIELIELERGIFLDGYVRFSDVVLFTGKYNNALKVKNSCPYALFIYNGAGINPILVAPDADVNLAVEKTIQTRIFNSGQDCAGPDSILVPQTIKKDFIQELIHQLDQIPIGDYHNRKNRIGRITKKDQLDNIEKILRINSKEIIYGGKIDFKSAIVYPTIIETNLCDTKNYEEFFSPIFFISVYEDETDLDNFFQNKDYMNYAMYVTVFGNSQYVKKIKNSSILINQNILDVEKGNAPYGGYGPKANFVQYGNKYFHSRPMLISKEIYLWQQEKQS